MTKRILFVDDEPNILKSLYRLFIETDYNLMTADNGEEALKKMEEASFDLVVSDMRMPNMDGFQFLSKVKELYPLTFRIILSGYTDEKMILKALQQNVAKHYVFKPWDNKSLVSLIDRIFETQEILGKSQLLEHINDLSELPTIKSSYRKIISLIEKDADMGCICKEIENDQSLATKVLHIANSAYYGVKTGSIRQAAAYLGLQNVKSLVLSTSVLEGLSINIPTKKRVESFWNHAFMTNRMLYFIYERCLCRKLEDINQAAGLLHNAGIVFFLKYYRDKYLSVIENAAMNNNNALDAEMEAFHFTHQEAGGYLLNWWELPFSIVEAALYHHQPLNPKIINKELVCAVHLAGKYSWDKITALKYSWTFHEEVFQNLGLEKSKFEEQLKQFKIT